MASCPCDDQDDAAGPAGALRTRALLEAACCLHLAGRERSASRLVDGLLDGPGAGLVEQGLAGLARQHLPFALICLRMLSRRDPARLDRCWAAIEAGTAGRLMEPALLKARLDHSEGGNGRPAGRDPGGPDLCYVLSVSLPQDTTGYSMRTQSLVAALQDHGLTIHCLTRPGFPWHRRLAGPAEPARIGPVTYHRCGSKAHRIPSDFASIRAAEAELVDRIGEANPKAVMAGSNHQTAIPAMLAARRLGLPFIYDVRGFWEDSRAAKDPGWGAGEGYRIACELEALAATRADLVLTLNPAMRDELILRGVRPERICLLPNAADPDRFMPRERSAALAGRLGIAADTPVIGYVGSFTTYEGLDDLVATGAALAQREQDFRMVIVGGEEAPRTAILDGLRRQAEAAGIADRIILPGRVPAEAVAEWYSLVDIAPLPRKPLKVTQTVSPLKPLEAMAMAKCVVVPDLPPFLDMVRHAQTGMVYRQGDTADLAATLEILIRDPALRQRLGTQARQWILAERTWDLASKAAAERIRDLT